ncbi:MAG: iron chelate uptake ABC transporter family permease subunit [Evtepia sp.]
MGSLFRHHLVQRARHGGDGGVALIWPSCCPRPMRGFSAGEGYARSVGVNVRRFRVELILLSSILSACVTAFAGPISFGGICRVASDEASLGPAKPIFIIPGVWEAGSSACSVTSSLRTCLAPVELSIQLGHGSVLGTGGHHYDDDPPP